MKFRLDNWSREDSRCFDELAELLSMERAEDGIPRGVMCRRERR